MTQIIDRRPNAKHKSAVNRQRFIDRYKNQIKKSVNNAIQKRNITDFAQGESIIIPKKDMEEPIISHGQGGSWERIHPGNKEFLEGDTIERPKAKPSGGSGGQASDQGEGEDDFIFELSREEFLDVYFEDLELPDMLKKQITQTQHFEYRRAGFSSTGMSANLNITRTMRQAHSRRIALSSKNKRLLKEKEAQLQGLIDSGKNSPENIKTLMLEIEKLQHKISVVPFIDTFDLRYHNKTMVPAPSTQSVMFCLMDVSGSMDETKKDIAKRFFILLYLFLTRTYKTIELVFIRHHTSAKEVTEEEFFYSRETGGTVVSSALELAHTIIQARYPSNDWNIYMAQASDGDNWNADSPYCEKILKDRLLPEVQYYAYTEIMPRQHQSLWDAYEGVCAESDNFAMETIAKLSDIYSVFRQLFKRD